MSCPFLHPKLRFFELKIKASPEQEAGGQARDVTVKQVDGERHGTIPRLRLDNNWLIMVIIYR